MAAVAIVGGAGFIGRRLVSVLRDAGHEVTVVDAAPDDGGLAGAATYRRADVRDRAALTAALEGAKAVYNLAAVHRDDIKPVSRYAEVNVAGAANVCGACQDLGIDRIVFTSTVSVYAMGTPDATELHAPAPFNPYGRSKLRAEQVHRAWQADAPAERSLTIVRPSVVFGEGNRGNVYQLVRQISTGRFLMIGSGLNRKSMAYVGNLVEFLVTVMNRKAGAHLFNYADKPDLSMQELVETARQTLGMTPAVGFRLPYVLGHLGGMACDLAAALTGRTLPISAVRIRKFCSTTTFAAERAQATGFRPPFPLHDALVRVIRHEFMAPPPPGRGRGRGAGLAGPQTVRKPRRRSTRTIRTPPVSTCARAPMSGT